MSDRSRTFTVHLEGDARNVGRAVQDTERHISHLGGVRHKVTDFAESIVYGFEAFKVVKESVASFTDAAREASEIAEQTTTVIRSTHGATNLSAEGFSQLAKKVQDLAAVDDDVIQGGENILATFTAIKAGGPAQIFERATLAAADMAAAMGHGTINAEGLQSANIQLGKALQDPIRGITALRKIGVDFNNTTRDQIKNLVQHGQVAKAQGIILNEVNKEFGGSARSSATEGKRLAVVWGNMQEILGGLLIPALDAGSVVLGGLVGVVSANAGVFGALGTTLGVTAAILLTLVGAHKVHLIVVDAVKTATAGWQAVQKGMNAVLAATRTQAGATAASEEVLAGATAASGVAASGASFSFGTLATRLGPIAALLFAVTSAVAALTSKSRELSDTGKDLTTATQRYGAVGGALVSQYQDLIGKTSKQTVAVKGQTIETAFAAKQQSSLHLEMVRSIPSYATAADKIALNADAAKKLSAQLATLRKGFKDQVASVHDSIVAYDGLISKSKITAAAVVKDIRNQVANFKTYSKDVHRLIAAGVNPAAIQELSTKGPQYVHALATGSNKQLGIYKQAWADRQREVKTSFAASMQAQFLDLVKKMRAMQREIDKLRGKNVDVGAHATVTIAKQTVAFLRATHTKIPQLNAAGGLIDGAGTTTSDSIPSWLSKREFVQPAAATDYYGVDFMESVRARQFPRFATGGLAGGNNLARIINADSAAVRKLGQHVADAFAAGVGNALSKAIADAAQAAASVGMGGPISLAGLPGGRAGIIALAQRMVTSRWSAAQWPPFVRLEMQEAGFNPFATNRSSGAFGIPQALPPTKMPLVARSVAAAGSILAMAAAQLRWMLGYIAGRYGNPAGAWAHEVSHNWYAGGFDGVIRRPTMIGVGEAGPERVTVTPVGRGGGFDYDRLAEALAAQPIIIKVSDDQLARVVRRSTARLDRQ
jgi:hypothetical protein